MKSNLEEILKHLHLAPLFHKMKPTKSIDFYQHVSVNIKMLQWARLWFFIPYPTLSFQFWFEIFFRVILGIFVFTIPPIGQAAYLIKLFMSGSYKIQDIASSINLILTELLTSVKLLDMFARRHLLRELIDQLVNGPFPRGGIHRTIQLNSIRLSKRLFYFFFTGAAVDIFFHIIVVPGLNKFQTTPVKMDLLFIDVYDPKYFSYVCFYQIIYKPSILVGYMGLQTMPWSVLLFAITQLDILIYNFVNMKKLVKSAKIERKCSENEAFKEVFTRCVLHHRAIIRFLNLVEAAFGGQFALTLILNACIICTTGVQFFSIESPSKDLVGVLWVLAYLQIFILIQFCDCYFGNAVFVKSTEVATVAFGCPWLNLSPKLKRNLIIFIARAQKPLVITAYSLVPISLPTFTKVMNWTYKAFAVMNEMKK